MSDDNRVKILKAFGLTETEIAAVEWSSMKSAWEEAREFEEAYVRDAQIFKAGFEAGVSSVLRALKTDA